MTQTPPPTPPPLSRLPLFELGFVNIPAVPYWADLAGDPDLDHIQATLAELQKRGAEGLPAYAGLGTDYTIDTQTHIAFEFLYGSPLARDATELPLDRAEDFTLPWTTYGNVYEDSQYLVAPFAKTLQETTDATRASGTRSRTSACRTTSSSWRRSTTHKPPRFAAEFGNVWKGENLDAAQKAGLLYAIDMSILDPLEPFIALDGTTRFTPGTITLLKQDPQTKELAPAAILVSTPNAGPPRVYGSNDAAWLWALQAAKTSITVWGIWLGHVYHLHIVTAAMQMTMFNTLPAAHPLRPLLEPQSQSLIDFDFVLLTTLFSKISPPTPVGGPMALLTLVDRFAENRTFFDDDPHAELKKRGLEVTDLTKQEDWDRYPLVGWLLDIWQITHDYVKAVVDVTYTNDSAVANDTGLEGLDGRERRPVAGQHQGVAGRPDARRAHESAHEPPVPGQRARGRNPDPVGPPGARLRRELPAVSPERPTFPSRAPRVPGPAGRACRIPARAAA